VAKYCNHRAIYEYYGPDIRAEFARIIEEQDLEAAGSGRALG